MRLKYLTNLGNALLNRNNTSVSNAFAEAFYSLVGGKSTTYDIKGETYITEGYNKNTVVYSIISQASTKLASVPCFLKEVEDKQAKHKLDRLLSKKELSHSDLVNKAFLEKKAFKEAEVKEPLERPNYYQTWSEFHALWETFMLSNGNAYIWMQAPSEGMNKGRPMQVFLLPSQYVKIVLKADAVKDKDIQTEKQMESPIDYFCLIIGNTWVQFPASEVIHTKYPNPNYDLQGAHLYGQSPLRAALSELNVSNSGTEQNVKTMKNAGVFGFIHGTDANRPLTAEQALALKDSLVEMERSAATLNRFKGSSAPVGFTKLSLNTDELKPFDYLNFSQKQICNVYAWPDELLNSDSGAKYDNMQEAKKSAITDRVQPDLQILATALNSEFYPRFKELKNVVKVFDISELPEMQSDMEKLTTWLTQAFDRGVITPDEYRAALRYAEVGDETMQTRYIRSGYVPLADVSMTVNPLDLDNDKL